MLSRLLCQSSIQHFDQCVAVVAVFMIMVLFDHALDGPVDGPVGLFLRWDGQVSRFWIVIEQSLHYRIRYFRGVALIVLKTTQPVD